MNKTIIILFFLFSIQAFSQNEETSLEDQIYMQVFGKCFTQLKPLPETQKRAKLNKITFCSLYQCVHYIEFVEYEKKIQDAILKRAIEITTLLYKNGTPVYLVTGMSSSDNALQKNINLNDDNKLVYISIAECVSSTTLQKIKETVNNETTKLIKQKNK
ncbi:hypothetical protein [uncultured Flavobacterium sp.]|uniref:hypothetical protein n=1 Tax=uncultured Flavobacterium sp. TaxID=165435 RepID=UPI00308175AB